MAQYTLQGTGVIALSSGVSQLRTAVTVFPTGYSTGRAIPTNYYDVGLLRLGNQGSYYPPVALDATDTIVDVPGGVTSLGYSLFGAATATATEVFAPVSNALLQPWDRHSQAWGEGARLGLNGGSAQRTMWSYTVPTGKILAICSMRGGVTRTLQATSVSGPYVQGLIGGVEVIFVQPFGNVAGDNEDDWVNGGTIFIQAGQVVQMNCANGDNSGTVSCFGYASGYTFDAAN